MSKIFVRNIQIKALVSSISKSPNVLGDKLIMLLLNGSKM
jgi:hypothetical protein